MMAFIERVASQGETTVLALSLEVSLVFLCRAFSSSEAKITLLLAPSGALSLASQQRSLALGALSLASRQRSLAPGDVSESDTEAATLLAPKGVLALAPCDRRGWTPWRVELASHNEAIRALSALVLPLAASLALPNSADDVSGAAVASLLTQSVLALASQGTWGLTLQRAEIVLWLENYFSFAWSWIKRGDYEFCSPHSLWRGCFRFTGNLCSLECSVNTLARGWISLFLDYGRRAWSMFSLTWGNDRFIENICSLAHKVTTLARG